MFPGHFNIVKQYTLENNETLTSTFHNDLVDPLDDTPHRYRKAYSILLLQNLSLMRGGIPSSPFEGMTHSSTKILRASQNAITNWSLDRLKTLKRACIVGALRRFEYITLLLADSTDPNLCDGKRDFLRKNANQNLCCSLFLVWLLFSRGGQDVIIQILDFFRERLSEIPLELGRVEYLKKILEGINDTSLAPLKTLVSFYFTHLIRPTIEETTEHTFRFFRNLARCFLTSYGQNTNDSSPYCYYVSKISAEYAGLRLLDMAHSHQIPHGLRYHISISSAKRRFWYALENIYDFFSSKLTIEGDLPDCELLWTIFNRMYIPRSRFTPSDNLDRLIWNGMSPAFLNRFITKTFHGDRSGNKRGLKFKKHPHMDELPYCLNYTLNDAFGPICDPHIPQVDAPTYRRLSKNLTRRHKRKVFRFKERTALRIRQHEDRNQQIITDRRLEAQPEVF